MPRMKGSKTEQNLLKSFAGESQARNRYVYAAKVADKEGYPLVAQIFRETAENEQVHAKNMFKFLEGGPVEITATYPAGVIGTTLENLEAAAAGENEEHTELYPAFAAVASEEGFGDVAALYRAIAKAESWHEERYRELIAAVREGTLDHKETTVRWKCEKCGYVHEGTEPPNTCPACKHPRKYFAVLVKNW